MHFHHLINICCQNLYLLTKEEKGDSIFRMDLKFKL
jgi:hypothetical protein